MNYLDYVFLLILLLFTLLGLKRGFIREVIKTFGFLFSIYLSFNYMHKLANVLMYKLPFFSFHTYPLLNIWFYKALSFLIIFAALNLVLLLLTYLSKMTEKILNLTIVLGFLNKLGGLLLGFIHGLVIVYILTIILSLPIFKSSLLNGSLVVKKMSNSKIIKKENINDFNNAMESLSTLDFKEGNENKNNKKLIDILFKYKISSKEEIENLIERDKLDEKYRKYLS